MRAERAGSWVGIGWMLAAAFFFTAETVCVKLLGPLWPAPVQLLWRQASALILMSPLIVARRRTIFRVTRPSLVLLRSLTAVLGLGCSIHAISHLPLATANALSFTRPILLALMAAWFLGERLDRRSALALAVGFAGVCLVASPFSRMSLPVLPVILALAAAASFAFSLVTVRALAQDHAADTLLVYGIILGLLFVAPVATIAWRWPQPGDALLLSGTGAASIGTIFCSVKGLASGEASIVGVAEYARLPMATIAGALLFADWPSGWIVVGGVLILLSVAIMGSRRAPAFAAEA